MVDGEPVVDGIAVEDVVVPAAAELVVRPDVRDDVFRAMDAHDELQILEALEGRPSKVMVYSFSSGGSLQTGLSFQGVAEVVRTMNGAGHTSIRVSPDHAPIVEEVQEENEGGDIVTYIQVTVYAEDSRNGGGNWGAARQAKFQTFRNKDRKPELDKFAYSKALSKAQRNAMLPLTPVVFRETLIAQMLNEPARVKALRVGMGDPVAEMPAPLTDERAEALKVEIRAVFKEIRDLDPTALMPGQFHVKLQRVAHEHAGMEELLEALRSQRDHLAAKATSA